MNKFVGGMTAAFGYISSKMVSHQNTEVRRSRKLLAQETVSPHYEGWHHEHVPDTLNLLQQELPDYNQKLNEVRMVIKSNRWFDDYYVRNLKSFTQCSETELKERRRIYFAGEAKQLSFHAWLQKFARSRRNLPEFHRKVMLLQRTNAAYEKFTEKHDALADKHRKHIEDLKRYNFRTLYKNYESFHNELADEYELSRELKVYVENVKSLGELDYEEWMATINRICLRCHARIYRADVLMVDLLNKINRFQKWKSIPKRRQCHQNDAASTIVSYDALSVQVYGDGDPDPCFTPATMSSVWESAPSSVSALSTTGSAVGRALSSKGSVSTTTSSSKPLN